MKKCIKCDRDIYDNIKECPYCGYNDLVQTDQSVFEIDDGLFADVLCFVVFENECLIKSIQEEFSIGFNRAQKMVSLFEQYDIVSKPSGTKHVKS